VAFGLGGVEGDAAHDLGVAALGFDVGAGGVGDDAAGEEADAFGGGGHGEGGEGEDDGLGQRRGERESHHGGRRGE
jgi:hypothetical protein